MLNRARFALAVTLALAASPALALTQVVVVSKAPYWTAGDLDPDLSIACSLGRFEPTRPGRLIARFIGPEGGGFLEIAKGTGLNLDDRDRRSRPNEDYFFRNSDTTDCEVFAAGRTAQRR